ncbi:HGR095Cp [Eremothecium sinecaudum]|uniref:Mitochondrial distribution and morphology protein 34 n=1 Tax=Eremothecium sinecaudum TaxID=45286 RepID=A0A0X8HVZ1_9SACH|nr:HGR095Cp [Eremothecium sinecaudum]AMD22434.1 HGR095Cp [Eremothecium sinecaudum]
MSFIFNKETFEDNSFNEEMRKKLTRALNADQKETEPLNTGPLATEQPGGSRSAASRRGSATTQDAKSGFRKVDILKSGITVTNVEFPTIPRLEILDLDVSTQAKSLIKGICKVSCRDAMVQITTEIEANLLLLHVTSSPKFVIPKLISNDSFTVPITMTFDKIHLEAISNIFVKNTGVGISFNDVNLDFQFQCSIKLLQSSIEKRLKASMEAVFKDVLPSVIFNMSQRWFTHGDTNTPVSENPDYDVSDLVHQPRTILDDSDLSDLSPANMLRLSTLVSSRQTLCLNSTAVNTISTIPGCLERQNLHRFNLRIPSLNNYYGEKDNDLNDDRDSTPPRLMGRSKGTPLPRTLSTVKNTLPSHVLNSDFYDLKTIAAIQTKIFERTGEKETSLRRRKIRIKKNSKREESLPLPPPKIPQPKTTVEQDPVLAESPQISPKSAKTPLVVCAPLTGHPNKLYLHLAALEELHNKQKRSEVQELRSPLYPHVCNKKFCIVPQHSSDTKDPSALLFDNGKRFGFVGLINSNSCRWGNDPPPPYRETVNSD